MAPTPQMSERRTTVDTIFEHLHDEIVSLRLLPGDKISEAEVASQFGVSRQPVRDAFSRLANQDLLLIRPQRATEVKRFSTREIEKSRFVRTAIETEVLRRASLYCDEQGAALLDAAIKAQDLTLVNGQVDAFSALDYEFHCTLCVIARADFAFEVIMDEKSKVDRLCVLGLSKETRMPELIEDHRKIANAVKAHDADTAVKAGMIHLGRLDETIEMISATNANYFEKSEA